MRPVAASSRMRMRMSVTVPIGTPRNFTGAPFSSPFTDPGKKITNVRVFRNRRPEPTTTTAAAQMTIANSTNAPINAGFARLPIGRRTPLVLLAPGEKATDLRIGGMLEKLFRRAAGDRRAGFRIEEHAVVGDREDARQLVRDHHDGGTEAVAQLENEVVEQARAHGIQ